MSAAHLSQCRQAKPQMRWEVSVKKKEGGFWESFSAVIKWGMMMLWGDGLKVENTGASVAVVDKKHSVVKYLIGKLQQKSHEKESESFWFEKSVFDFR